MNINDYYDHDKKMNIIERLYKIHNIKDLYILIIFKLTTFFAIIRVRTHSSHGSIN